MVVGWFYLESLVLGLWDNIIGLDGLCLEVGVGYVKVGVVGNARLVGLCWYCYNDTDLG